MKKSHPFLRLPQELRNQIYTIALTDDNGFFNLPTDTTDIALLHISKQTHDEVKDILINNIHTKVHVKGILSSRTQLLVHSIRNLYILTSTPFIMNRYIFQRDGPLLQKFKTLHVYWKSSPNNHREKPNFATCKDALATLAVADCSWKGAGVEIRYAAGEDLCEKHEKQIPVVLGAMEENMRSRRVGLEEFKQWLARDFEGDLDVRCECKRLEDKEVWSTKEAMEKHFFDLRVGEV
ncbi:hypothetical protein EJ08DRAFT_694179 [Tothia fuscella]|uniref:Uncharacterized protein n=1 Tax=Tothia fuscella TaxID=1048955 RepID=A0A9P4NYH6_9PEZI|nr:hypothetical protein EJ08DRAFT_694179 [Tothia fuscella]